MIKEQSRELGGGTDRMDNPADMFKDFLAGCRQAGSLTARLAAEENKHNICRAPSGASGGVLAQEGNP